MIFHSDETRGEVGKPLNFAKGMWKMGSKQNEKQYNGTTIMIQSGLFTFCAKSRSNLFRKRFFLVWYVDLIVVSNQHLRASGSSVCGSVGMHVWEMS